MSLFCLFSAFIPPSTNHPAGEADSAVRANQSKMPDTGTNKGTRHAD